MLSTPIKMMHHRKGRVPVEGLFCNYPHRACMQNRVEGSEYCIRHVLEDKNGSYKQCSYMSNKNGKRCTSAVHKGDKRDGYCFEHARKASMQKAKISRKRKPRESPETLLEQVEHYGSKTEDGDRAIRRARMPNESVSSKILDYASSSDSESEQTLVEQSWRGDGDSDADSVDSEQEDHLKHAGVYTAEEVAQITRDKLIRLQCLYIEQFKRLLHVMKERRRKYLHEVHREKDSLGSISAAKQDPEEREKYDRLVAANRYHRRFGKEALLHRQLKEQRIAITEGTSSKPSYAKCIFNRKGSRCALRTMPLSKYCLNHVMHDSQQVLYQTCSYGNGVCKRPVSMTMVGDMGNCSYHKQLVEGKKRYPPPPKEEPMEDSIDVVGETEIKMEVPASSVVFSLSSQSPSESFLISSIAEVTKTEPLS